jgi:hypothetical protein
VRYEDGGRRRGRGRSRHLAILGDIGAGEVNYDEEGVWTTGRLNVYILCGNANKIYLDALWRRHAALPADYSRKCLRVQSVCRMCLPRDIPVSYWRVSHWLVTHWACTSWVCISLGVHLTRRVPHRCVSHWACTSSACTSLGVHLLGVYLTGRAPHWKCALLACASWAWCVLRLLDFFQFGVFGKKSHCTLPLVTTTGSKS